MSAGAGEERPVTDSAPAREGGSRIYETIITSSDEKYAPPDESVLSVSIIGPDAYLMIGKYEDGNGCRTMTPTAQIAVPLRDLLAALYAPLDTATFTGELRRVG